MSAPTGQDGYATHYVQNVLTATSVVVCCGANLAAVKETLEAVRVAWAVVVLLISYLRVELHEHDTTPFASGSGVIGSRQ